MEKQQQMISIKVVNNPTVLVRVIQAVKRRQINIQRLVAEDVSVCDARITLNIKASDEQTRLLKSQINKLIDVMEVKTA